MLTSPRHPTHLRARNPQRLWIAAGLLALLACLVLLGTQRAGAASASSSPISEEALEQRSSEPLGERPSFVVIQTDDETLDQLYTVFNAGGIDVPAMPNTLSMIAGRGITFNRYYVSYPLCCPSRVSLMTGRYAHNTNVRGNVQPNGGYLGFKSRGAFTHNIATWLQGAGYRTIHIGKFLNGYGDEPYDNGTDAPPGWSAWHRVENADTHRSFYGYSLNDNGTIGGRF